MNAMNEAHQRHAHEPHWYVWAFATRPEVQGQGHGRKMMRWLTMVSDFLRVKMYLETAGERNERFYRKNGFKVVEMVPFGDKTDAATKPGFDMTVMTRLPGTDGDFLLKV